MSDGNGLSRLAYKDFTIEFTQVEGVENKFRVRAVAVPGHDPMLAAEAEKLTFAPGDLEKSISRLKRRKMQPNELLEFGETLGKMMLPGKVGHLFAATLAGLQKGEGVRLRLAFEPLPLAALPWEYALIRRAANEATPNDFLCLRPEISITRSENVGQPLGPLAVGDKFKLVVALANPDGSSLGLAELDLDADRRAIQGAVDALNRVDDFIEAVYLQPATRQALEAGIGGAHIFHFGGHGVFDGAELMADGSFRKKGKILLEDNGNVDLYDSDTLANLLAPGAGAAGVRLAVLGACNGATRDAGGAWTGVAPALVKENIPAVLAMQFRVADRAAVGFMLKFYSLVLAGFAVDQAVSEGRGYLFRNPGAQGDWAVMRDWGTPVLYLRPADGVLFPQPQQVMTEEVGAGGQPILNAFVKAGRVADELGNVEIDVVLEGVINANMEVGDILPGSKVKNVVIKTFGSRRNS